MRWVDLLESDAGLPEALAELDLPDLVVEDILEQPQRRRWSGRRRPGRALP
ncbi:MAG: hypothetical protein R2749_21175 [Acidimicrobiales bacterium]